MKTSARHLAVFLVAASVVLSWLSSCAPRRPGPSFANQTPTIVEGTHAMRARESSYEPLQALGNAHALRTDGRIARGASPTGRAKVLLENGVTDVLMVRNAVGREGETERDELRRLGYRDDQIHEVPMVWRDLESFEAGCRNAVAALRIMAEVDRDPRRKLYMHCTMGEDRTGLIAGLYRIVFQGWRAEAAYRDEMCARGFAEASQRKPAWVSDAVNGALKPVFARMAAMAEAKVLAANRLDDSRCAQKVSEARVREIAAVHCSLLASAPARTAPPAQSEMDRTAKRN